MPNLYTLTEQYRALEDAAYNQEFDYNEFDKLLNEIEGDIEEKIDGYCKVIAALKADATAIKEEEARLANRRRSLENRVEHLKTALSVALDAQGRDKVKTAMFTVYHASGVKLELTDIGAVPEEYIKPRTLKESDINKKAIAEYIKETGEVLPYARLVAGRSLNIR